MSELLRAFFEDLARIEEYARNEARAALQDPTRPTWAEDHRPFRVLGERSRTEQEIEAFARVVGEIVHVAIHSALVSMDGGGASAEVGRIHLVDENGQSLGEGLHESFVEYMFETGRIE